MAKAPAKKTTKPAAKASPKKAATKTPKKKPAKSLSLEEASEAALSKLKLLDLDAQLQSDLEWCLGSYRHDKNPVGLLESCERAVQVFKTEMARKTKGITEKLIADLERVIAS